MNHSAAADDAYDAYDEDDDDARRMSVRRYSRARERRRTPSADACAGADAEAGEGSTLGLCVVALWNCGIVERVRVRASQ